MLIMRAATARKKLRERTAVKTGEILKVDYSKEIFCVIMILDSQKIYCYPVKSEAEAKEIYPPETVKIEKPSKPPQQIEQMQLF